jgi:hypothetical protein
LSYVFIENLSMFYAWILKLTCWFIFSFTPFIVTSRQNNLLVFCSLCILAPVCKRALWKGMLLFNKPQTDP